MKVLIVLIGLSFIGFTLQADHFVEEVPNYIYNVVKYFIVLPVLERIFDHFSYLNLLPDDLEHFDFHGNFIGSTKDLLANDEICTRMLNYTETFKNFADHLYRGRREIPKDSWTDPKGIFNYPRNKDFFLLEFDKLEPFGALKTKRHIPYFNPIQYEKSAEKWEDAKGSFFPIEDGPVDLKSMPKTFSAFRYIELPLRSRFAVVLESYLVDLAKLFYPYMEESRLGSFEDLLALVLFYLYVNLDEKSLCRVYTLEIINDLKEMGTILKLPNGSNLKRIKCLKMLFRDVLKYELYFTFQIFLHSKIFNNSSSTLIKNLLRYHKNDKFLKLFLKEVNRNAVVENIGDGYDGHLCHAVYWSQIPWLFEEFLRYEDVDWNAVDRRGYTVLGHMVHDKLFDERYRKFLKSTKHCNLCYKCGDLRRNVLDECLTMQPNFRALSRFSTFLNERTRSDDFGELLISAALHNRPDYFDLILSYRCSNSSHELDSAFQLLLQYMGMDELYLYSYLVRMLAWGREWHGTKGHKLEHMFFMKWEIQLGRWAAAADEMDIKLIR